MTIDPDVRGIGTQYGGAQSLMSLVQAIVTAEGNIVAAVRCSVEDLDQKAAAKSRTVREEAIHFTYQSVIHRMSDWIKEDHPREFVMYLGSKWAPVGAANDPTGLNAFWMKNVSTLWGV